MIDKDVGLLVIYLNICLSRKARIMSWRIVSTYAGLSRICRLGYCKAVALLHHQFIVHYDAQSLVHYAGIDVQAFQRLSDDNYMPGAHIS
jgi:hypothetical protein